MKKVIHLLALLCSMTCLADEISGKRLAYLVGCINCHHQSPKEIFNAPPLSIVQAYSLPEFKTLMKTGVTRTGRNMLAESNAMGIVAAEQFSHFTDDEVDKVYRFLRDEWTSEMAAKEEAKIPLLFKKHYERHSKQ